MAVDLLSKPVGSRLDGPNLAACAIDNQESAMEADRGVLETVARCVSLLVYYRNCGRTEQAREILEADVAGGVVVDRGPRNLDDARLDRVHQREVADGPREDVALVVTGSGQVIRGSRQVIDRLDSHLAQNGLEATKPHPGILVSLLGLCVFLSGIDPYHRVPHWKVAGFHLKSQNLGAFYAFVGKHLVKTGQPVSTLLRQNQG